MNPHVQGNPSKKCDATAAVAASTRQGVNAKRITPNDSLRKATGSKPSPALVKITAKAMFLYK